MTLLRQCRAYAWCALIAGLLCAGAAWGAQSAPRATVEQLHGVLVKVMKEASSLGFDGRSERLAPVIAASFDLPDISRIVMGRYWAALQTQDQQRMVDAFTRLTVATYAGRFDGYSGERFETVAEQQVPSGRMLIRTELRKSNGDKVQLDYLLQDKDGAWRIVNVVADGVSDLALKRTEYAAVMATHGFDVLLAKLREKTAEQATPAKK
jgi:phospholipid transport system substrate-binding protein